MTQNARAMKRLHFPIALAVALAVWAPSVGAQLIPSVIPASGMIGRCSFITGDFHFDCIPLYLGYLIQLVFGLLGTVCLIEIIWAGYEWAFSGLTGDNQKAKGRLTNAILGLIFSLLAFLIVDTVVSAIFAGPAS